jgi:saccharopine dehydrogenase-like NADP-dependent oxidoreductase
MELQEKTAIITGSAKGIGFEIARTFARQGACVVLVDRSGAEKAAESLKNQHYDAIPVSLDITDMKAVNNAVEAVANAKGHIDILVNNAGIIARGDILDLSREQWLQVMDVNKHNLDCRKNGRYHRRARLRHFQRGDKYFDKIPRTPARRIWYPRQRSRASCHRNGHERRLDE